MPKYSLDKLRPKKQALYHARVQAREWAAMSPRRQKRYARVAKHKREMDARDFERS